VIDDPRVVRADAVWLTPQDEARQAAAVARAAPGGHDPDRVRLLVAPTLAIESVSPGHEAHDRRTKRKWYAEFGVPHYWIFDPFNRSLDCLVLEAGAYRVDQSGHGDSEVRAPLFPGLVLRLRDIWAD